ncbi:MAG: hypothetical protein ACFFDB_00635 [Promethearchaeota archaeon]
MIPNKLANVIKFEDRFFRKEQVLLYEIDGEVEIITNQLGEIIEIRKTNKTKTLKINVDYLDNIFKVVRAYNPEIDGDGLKCSLCGQPQTSNGYFIEKINPSPDDNESEIVQIDGENDLSPIFIEISKESNFFVGYWCWKSNLSPKP